MPNWKKVITSGSDAALNTLNVTNGITGSLYGTASWAISSSQAISSSYAASASYSQTTAETSLIVLNQTGFNILKGWVVRITGSNNNSDIPRITTASYENDNNSANTLGIATEDINTGTQGRVITEGVLTGIDTNNYVSGQLLYLGPTGSIIATTPTAPLHSVRLGEVIRQQSNNGSIYVSINNGYELGELHDVLDSTTTASYGDLITKSGSIWTTSKQLTGSYGLTGSLTATSFTGSLHGTSSWANNAQTASYVENAQTASFVQVAQAALFITLAESASYVQLAQSASYVQLAQSASYVQNAQTASYVLNAVSSSVALTASYVNELNQHLVVTGALELKSTNLPTIDLNSGYLFLSQSEDAGDPGETDIYYYHKGNKFSFDWIEGQLDTGIKWGGVVTFSGTTIYVTPGSGLVVNHNPNTSSYGDTQVTTVNWGPITASNFYMTSSQVTYLLIDSDGTLLQQNSVFTPQQYNEKFPLGYIFCLTTSSISSFADGRVTTYGTNEQQSQFIRAFGPLKINGFDLTAQTGSLKFSVASGRSYRAGGFYSQNPDEPSIYDSSNVPTASIVRVYRDPAAVGGFKATLNGFVPYTTVDPTMWDDGSGTLQSVGASEWTIQRVFQGVVNGISYVYYGQNKYSSLALALQSIATDDFQESQTSIIALPFVGYIVAKGNTTDLGDTTNNRLINAGLFRNTAGSSGGGGAAVTNLNDLSDVNLSSPSTGQALIYSAGSWINGTPLNSTSASYSETASYAPNAIATASVSLNTITFTKGDGSTFPITVNTGSGGGGISTVFNVNTVSGSNSTASLSDFVLVSASAHTVLLPAASNNGRVTVKWIVAPTTGSIKTSGSGVTIDGSDRSTTGLGVYNQWDAYSFISNGTNWFIMG